MDFSLGRPCPGALIEGGGAFDVVSAAAAAFAAEDAIAAFAVTGRTHVSM
jgi:hypothetical protein